MGQGAQEENLGYASCAKPSEGERSLCRDWTMTWETVREFQARRHNTMGKRGGALNGAHIRWAIGCHKLQEHNYEGHQSVSLAGAAKRTWPAPSVLCAEAAIFISIKNTLGQEGNIHQKSNVGHGIGWTPTAVHAIDVAYRDRHGGSSMRRK